ncbi:MAG: DNA repair protein RecN [Coriobacteriia bacterium]|nr:DNA repair protein RecN [Coriobacteriia bacterium]
MLQELHVRDLALIEEAWIELGPGMTVLTGETGAGKTVLVGALKLLLGERADSTLVRQGAAEALVEGRWCRGGEERLARRRLSADGRSRCALDGEMATVGALAEALGPLVDLHGQHEHQALLSAARHAAYLDRFVGDEAASALRAYRDAFDARAEAADGLEALRASLADRERRLDYLRFQVTEIAAAAPGEGEDAAIEATLPALRHGERLTSAAASAYRALREDGGAVDSLAAARRVLAGVGGIDPALDALAEELEGAAASLEEAAWQLRSRAEAVAHDPRELDEAESRLATLQLLKKKYGPTLADVLRTRAEAEAEISGLESAEEGLRAAEEGLRAAEEGLRAAGERLAALRGASSGRFTELLAEAAGDLAMTHASFDVALEDLPFGSWTREGPQRVEFTYSPGPGQQPRPLARIASGGELSRVMLALKGVLGAADDVPVMVFDEVDAGVGGATASSLGRRLAELARSRQVLVVTHLAQVAVYADAHVVVEKSVAGGQVVTVVRPVLGEERVEELARMLSGSDSDASLAHARELLEGVGPPGPGRGIQAAAGGA